MGLFDRKEGGVMDVIRCDQKDYLIWKWTPTGKAGTTAKENAIRWGSSLRVKDGEVAVFVYAQDGGIFQDFIVGPFDQIIKTDNLPIITGIIGLAYAGKAPFQAEIYYINLAGNVPLKFGVPYFDVFDPRFLDFAVPMAVRGTIIFNIQDYRAFVNIHRLISFSMADFSQQMRDALAKNVKDFVTNLPANSGLPALQIERKLLEINEWLKPRVLEFLVKDFGVNLKRLDLSAIEVDKESPGYKELRNVTAVQQTKTIEAQTDINLKNLAESQRINAANMEETLRIQREEAQRKQRLQTESQHLPAHQIDQQTAVLTAAATSLGSIGDMSTGGGGSGGGLNPAGMMIGLMMGGAVGGQMANLMNQMGSAIQQQPTAPPVPPVPPQILYNVSVDGQSTGPFSWTQLQELARSGQLTHSAYVWKAGMANWVLAGDVQELAPLLDTVPPPPPRSPT